MTAGVNDVTQAPRARVAVVGAGYMGGGIAQSLALAGHEVALVDADPARTTAAVERLRAQLDDYAAAGLVDPERAGPAAGRLAAATSIADAVASADYVTEAVFEDAAVKRRVLREISGAAPAGAIIATNTSALPSVELVGAVSGPERFLVAHWFNPAPFVPLVELAAGTEETTVRVEALLRGAGKLPVRVADVPGFLGNRLQLALYREAALVVEEGLADAATVDAVVSNSMGLRLPFLGPLLVGDIAGLDVYAAILRTLEAHYGERFSPPASLLARVADGDLGVKTGGGLRGVPAEERDALAAHRDRSSVVLQRLRAELAERDPA